MLILNEVKTLSQVEWLRTQRNDPLQYRYFRQDKPITLEQQNKWWRSLDKTRCKLFIIEKDGMPIGYVGFNPLNRYASNAEFGIFIIKEYQGKGYAQQALKMLLKYGFEELHLACIYSDCLQYPGEDRFKFYKDMGFVERENYIPKTYPKRINGETQRIPAMPFYMTRYRWLELNELHR